MKNAGAADWDEPATKGGAVEAGKGPSVLADLVAYQDGSVVSRTLIARKTGTVTLFAFAQGQGLSEHTAPFEAMVCVLEGTAEVSIAGKPHRVGAGQMICLPARVSHALHAEQPFKMMLIMIRS